MSESYQFDRKILECVVGGVSALDTPRLNLHTIDEARQFIQAYGYDLEDPLHSEQLWAAHRRAISIIREYLLEEGDVIPEVLSEKAQLQDLAQLLVYASHREIDKKRDPRKRDLQRWACGILRVMHVYIHMRSDLFSAFSDEIQYQILKPLQDVITDDPVAGSTFLGRRADFDGIKLAKFEIKPFKTTASSVVKLLARPEKVALTLLDKLGVRFVTRSSYDAFRVIRYLVDQHIITYAHIIPDQSNNTLFPLNIFLEVMQELDANEKKQIDGLQIENLLRERLEQAKGRAEYLEKFNMFSATDYRFIKFISRKLITVNVGENEQKKKFRFFYPYEIQIMDYETYVKNLSGPMAHDEYKLRQRKRARERVFGIES